MKQPTTALMATPTALMPMPMPMPSTIAREKEILPETKTAAESAVDDVAGSDWLAGLEGTARVSPGRAAEERRGRMRRAKRRGRDFAIVFV